jgi:peptide methionine sulfoxide reductase msrA/msrB
MRPRLWVLVLLALPALSVLWWATSRPATPGPAPERAAEVAWTPAETAHPPRADGGVPAGKESHVADRAERVARTDDEWRRILTPEQFRVTREKGTERAFTGKYWDNHEDGMYYCADCGAPLFRSTDKFDSGCGWPSFTAPVRKGAVREQRDMGHDMVRTEAICPRCGAHLGNVFDDGPMPMGLLYCINSASLGFEKAKAGGTNNAYFAAGCFWGVEAPFQRVPGVVATTVGYSGGHTPNPTYEQVCTHTTGHAETVEVEYDPGKVSYAELLDVFWKCHDPTTLNRQGPDVGSQYRSAIFYVDEEQKDAAEQSKGRQEALGRHRRKIVTEITKAGPFYPAEEYHQHYLQKRGQAVCH